MEKHKEIIECPECGKRQIAEVLHTLPWWSYVHNCVSCKYTIMESEWTCTDTEEEMEIKEANDEMLEADANYWLNASHEKVKKFLSENTDINKYKFKKKTITMQDSRKTQIEIIKGFIYGLVMP